MYNKEISKLKNKLISLGEQEEAKLLEKRANPVAALLAGGVTATAFFLTFLLMEGLVTEDEKKKLRIAIGLPKATDRELIKELKENPEKAEEAIKKIIPKERLELAKEKSLEIPLVSFRCPKEDKYSSLSPHIVTLREDESNHKYAYIIDDNGKNISLGKQMSSTDATRVRDAYISAYQECFGDISSRSATNTEAETIKSRIGIPDRDVKSIVREPKIKEESLILNICQKDLDGEAYEEGGFTFRNIKVDSDAYKEYDLVLRTKPRVQDKYIRILDCGGGSDVPEAPYRTPKPDVIPKKVKPKRENTPSRRPMPQTEDVKLVTPEIPQGRTDVTTIQTEDEIGDSKYKITESSIRSVSNQDDNLIYMTRDAQPGVKGPILYLQHLLNQKGESVTTDGYYGPATKKAIFNITGYEGDVVDKDILGLLIDDHPNPGYKIQFILDQDGIDPNIYNQLTRQERKQLARDMSSENGKLRIVNRIKNKIRNKNRGRRRNTPTINLPGE